MPTQQELDAASKKMQDAIAGKNPTAVSGVTTTGAPMLTGLAKTGATGPEGAYNPYTKGYETANGGVGVNQGQYSAQAKADLAKSYGYDPMKVGLDQFERKADGSLGIKLPDVSKQTTPAPVVPEIKPTTEAPIQPATPETSAAPAAPVDPAETLALEKKKLADEKTAKNVYYANEQTRLAREKLDADSKAQLDETQRKYDEAIAAQQDRMNKDAANAGVILGTQGAARSMRAQQAVAAMNQKNRDLYSSMIISKDRATQQMAEGLKRAQESMDLKYKEQVTAAQDEMLKQLRAMDSTGELNSKKGFEVARSFLESTLDQTIGAQEDYVAGLTAGYEQWKAQAEATKAQSEVDTNLTKQMNDGFVYNKFGQKVQQEDEMGNPAYVTYEVANDEKFLSNVTLPDGTNGAIMQKSDGSTYLKEFRSSNVSSIQPDQITAYAQAYAQGKLPDATLKSLPQSVQAQIIQQAVATGFSGNLESVTVKVNGKDKTMLFDKSTGTYTDPFATSQEGSIASGVTVSEDGTVAFDDKAEAAARKAGINVDLLEVPDGTVRKRAECGQYVNDVLGTPSKFKDSIEDKVKACNASKPSVGSAVVLDVGTSTGHVGIVVGVDEEAGEIIVKSSNAHGYDENGNPTGISTDRISYMDDQGNMNPAVKGFYAPKFEGDTMEGAKPQEKEYADLNLTSRILNATSGASFGEKEMESATRKVELGRAMGKSDAEILNDVAGFNVPKDKAELGNTAIEWLNKVGVTTANSKYAKAIAANITDNNLK